MLRDYSYGVIPLRRWRKQWQILLVQHQPGHWAFPKGHAEKGESPQQAAERELFEETGLKVKEYFFTEGFNEHYQFFANHQRIDKTVHYFVARVSGKLQIQAAELQTGKWLSFEQAKETMTFAEGKRLCQKVQGLLEASEKKDEKDNVSPMGNR